jgi:endonuclease/exonuclease/phosphatase family metal-dependent hydrolase
LNERALSGSLEATPPLATYPSRLPFLPLDRIWFSAPLGLVTAATLNDTEHVSDHLPLFASLCLEGREGSH